MKNQRKTWFWAVALAAVFSAAIGSTTAWADQSGGDKQVAAAPPPSGSHVQGTFYAQQQNGNLAQGDLNLSAQVPRPDPNSSVGGGAPVPAALPTGYGTAAWTPPLPGTACSSWTQVSIDLASVNGFFRKASWKTPKDLFPTYDVTKPAPGWYELAPGRANILGDGSYDAPAEPSDHSPEAEAQAVHAAALYAGSQGIGIKYQLVGKIAPVLGGVACLITDWKYDNTYTYGLRTCQELTSQGKPCTQPLLALTPPGQPPCSTVACIPAVQTVAPPPPLIDQAKRFWTDGGSVIASPEEQWEIVQVPVQLSLQGTPATQPDQYYQRCVPVGAVRLTSACFQIHLHLTQATWMLSQDSVTGSRDICTGTTCTYTFDTIGKYHVRVLEDVSVEYRYVMFVTPQNAIYQGWRPYPGQSGFQLCALGAPGQAVALPPDCGPGAALSVGQFEAVPTTPR